MNGEGKGEGEVEGVIFVPYTEKASLKNNLQSVDDRVTKTLRIPRMRYVERPGTSLAASLCEKDPWYRLGGGCRRKDCPVCRTHHNS